MGIRLAACAALLRLRLAEFENSDKSLAVVQHAVLPPSGGGGGFSPQSGSPGGGLTATYRTPYEEPCAYELSAAEGVF